eukprot:gnl/TRDRNA2_/TRDRNA2_176316_c1_seq2.p1 gnl/TRDRNA2_/TRDRNA2_176316_c1~~gnl/TRDRNA2_/TRDRNA2_176316_c1_seq2.p1  ORF type:complete len:674 (+),score=171.92 gnl/TRDRNA2_/TRDRNA2_176316_c1_seq2:51-2024(+)
MATEQKAYDKYACWCENVSKEKAQSIAQAKQEIRVLGQQILKLKGRDNSQAAEVEENKHQDIKNNKERQEAATAVRQKENAEYLSTTAEIYQALKALEEAIKILKDATAASLLQRGTSALRERASVALTTVMMSLPTVNDLNKDQVKLLTDFVQTGQSSFATYAPQSATIQGILQDMYQNFARMLQKATLNEARRNREFEDLINSEQSALIELQKHGKKTENKKASTLLSLSEASQTYDDMEAQMEADIEFFDAMKESCQAKSAEWTVRKKKRLDEISGVKLALEILLKPKHRRHLHHSSHSLFTRPAKWHGASFLQVDSSRPETMEDKHRRLAYDALKSQATKAHSIRLAQLAATVHDGHFPEVMKAIDEIILLLKEEEASDIHKKDWCKEEYHDIASKSNALNFEIQKSEVRIEQLNKMIEQFRQEKDETISEIKKTSTEIKEMMVERAQENRAFLHEKEMDIQSIKILDSAKVALGQYYRDEGLGEEAHRSDSTVNVGMLQEPVFEISKEQAPDATFADKGSRVHQAQGIIGLMSILKEDLDKELEKGAEDEMKAQKQFEEQLADARSVLEKLFAKKTELMQIIADRDTERAEGSASVTSSNADLRAQETQMKAIKADCDWILSAFDKRKDARALEMDGLTTAKEYLSGARGLE